MCDTSFSPWISGQSSLGNTFFRVPRILVANARRNPGSRTRRSTSTNKSCHSAGGVVSSRNRAFTSLHSPGCSSLWALASTSR